MPYRVGQSADKRLREVGAQALPLMFLPMHANLRSFIDILRRENEIVEVTAEVDPYLEIAEIHRRAPAVPRQRSQ